MTKWKWFSDEEAKGLDYGLMVRLDMARELCGFPIVITSGRRTEEQNENAGGTKESSHLKGLAVDLKSLGAPPCVRGPRFRRFLPKLKPPASRRGPFFCACYLGVYSIPHLIGGSGSARFSCSAWSRCRATAVSLIVLWKRSWIKQWLNMRL